MKKTISFIVLIVVLLLTLATFSAGAQDQPYAGMTIDILTFTGPQIAEPLQRRAPDFAAATGATVNVVTVPFADLYQTILTDQATGTNSYEGFVFAPQWMVDYVGPGYLADLTDWVNNDPEIDWQDVGAFFRDFSATFNGSVYSIPLDGDFHMVYYRTDVLEQLGMEPPKTWDDYLAIAAAANGTDMNGDGAGDYGSCISKKRNAQAYWWIISIAGGGLQTQGTSQGAFFDTTTFEPLVNNPVFVRALEIYQETSNYGPPDELILDVGDTRGLWTAGRCALTLDWGDIGSLAVAPDSQVNGLTGAVITPGWTSVLDRATNEMVACDATTCPLAVDGVNYAPFASFGGWSGGVSAGADPAVQEATYAFLAYMSAPAQANVDVTIGATGFNPYRTSQFEELQPWLDAGFSEESAANYLGAIQQSLNSPNMILDLRVPQNQRYEQRVLDLYLSEFLAGVYSAAETAQTISDEWNAISDELGRDTQQAAYLGSLGVER
jgi:multiple sugar transport system substrate-binding protein